MDVRKNSSLGDGDVSEELVQLFVVSDGELNVSWGDTAPFVVLGGVSGEFQELRGEVLEDGGEVDRSSGTDALSEATLSKVACQAADRELQSCLGGPGGGFAFLAFAFTLSCFSSWHLDFLGLELEDS